MRSRAAEWRIDPTRIGIVGFSAGGHLALATAAGFARRKYDPIDAVDQVSCRPDFAIACYPGYLKAKDKNELAPGIEIPPGTPPIFLAHASDDNPSYGGSLPENSALMYLALEARECRPNCISSPRVTTTSACARTKSSRRAGRSSASNGCKTSACL